MNSHESATGASRNADIDPVSFFEPARSLDELAVEQGVAPLVSLDELVGRGIDDFDDFLAAIASLRGDGQ
ncbi:hypothetical protein [Streptomyces sp. NPDC003077]|uniref:hypothetical protein n=1 Tax=Streptomyces sp. NPDC003077 TaxID=3154443 RepID=UPI0033BCE35F